LEGGRRSDREQDGGVAITGNFRDGTFLVLIWSLVGNCFEELSLCLAYSNPSWF
jgi:hypothetical protein